MIFLYNTILYYPLLNALIFFYNTIAFEDLGLAIIFLTILIRLLLFPLFHKSARHQTIMQGLQPHLKKIQEDHKGNREKQAQATMAFYKERGINPFSGFLLILIQLPIMIAIYQIFLKSLDPGALMGLYGFVSAPTAIKTMFLGLINLKGKSILMVALAALAQYFQGKMSLPQVKGGEASSPAERASRQMVFLGPVITLIVFYGLPAAISLYWLVATIFSIFQQKFINKQIADAATLGTINPKNS